MRHRTAFTLIELLVVVAIIVALLAILSPSLGRAQFTAQVAVCASQFHQATAALNSYAADHFGLYPRHDIGPLTAGGNLWDVDIDTPRAFHRYGYTYNAWECPTRDTGLAEKYKTVDEALVSLLYKPEFPRFILFPQHFFVPRRDVVKWVPHAAVGTLSVPEFYPNSIGHPRTSVQPLLSDQMLTTSIHSNPLDPRTAGGGHSFAGVCESSNNAFADGHVELHRTPDEVKYVFLERWNWW